MNPYVLTGLVMCGVILIAIVLTAYLAVYFTRRAKADLEAALAPLAELLGGTMDLDGAEVTGRYHGKLAFGRMTHADGGPVRVFQTDVIDAAGGDRWLYARIRPGRNETQWTERIEPDGVQLAEQIPSMAVSELPDLFIRDVNWFQVEYSADGGYVRLTKPMQSRKDIPAPADFEVSLAALDRIADQNRAAIERQGDLVDE